MSIQTMDECDLCEDWTQAGESLCTDCSDNIDYWDEPTDTYIAKDGSKIPFSEKEGRYLADEFLAKREGTE